MSYVTTTSVFHLAIHHTLPRPVPLTWQCVIRYHNQCNMTMRHTLPQPVQHGNVSYGTTTSVFHLAMCHTVPWLVPFTCQYVIRYHNQCNMTMRHTVPRPVQHDNAPYGNTTSVFHLAMCHTVPRPAPFIWHKGWKFDSKFWQSVLFQWLGTDLWFSPDTAFERRH